jgi:hypothetical protein
VQRTLFEVPEELVMKSLRLLAARVDLMDSQTARAPFKKANPGDDRFCKSAYRKQAVFSAICCTYLPIASGPNKALKTVVSGVFSIPGGVAMWPLT